MLSGDYPADLYVLAKCSARRKAVAATLLLPFGLANFVLDGLAGRQNPNRAFVDLLWAVFRIVVLIPRTLEAAWSGFVRDPLVIEGAVSELHKTRFGTEDSIGLFFRLLQRRRIRITVTYTARIGRRGLVTRYGDAVTFIDEFVDQPWGDEESESASPSQARDVVVLSVSRGVYGAVAAGCSAILLCTSSGHGIAVLSKRPEASRQS